MKNEVDLTNSEKERALEERLRVIRAKSRAAADLRKSQMPWWTTDDIYVRWLIPVTPLNN